MDPSVQDMWARFQRGRGEPAGPGQPVVVCSFSDNAADADALAELVLRGVKRATSPSLWWFEATGEPVPEVGDLQVVVAGSGLARCVIQTIRVEVVPFDQISEEYARVEGEGDFSLEYWKRVHWDYYHRELAGTGRTPIPQMPIVCEYFERVFPPPTD